MITIHTTSRYKVDRKALANHAESYLKRHGIHGKAVNIAFIGKRKMREIANEYKHEDVALPVLSFPVGETDPDSESSILGDVMMCYPQIVLLAAEKNKSVDIMIQNLIDHGISNLIMKG